MLRLIRILLELRVDKSAAKTLYKETGYKKGDVVSAFVKSIASFSIKIKQYEKKLASTKDQDAIKLFELQFRLEVSDFVKQVRSQNKTELTQVGSDFLREMGSIFEVTATRAISSADLLEKTGSFLRNRTE